jgi:hypothetical protein
LSLLKKKLFHFAEVQTGLNFLHANAKFLALVQQSLYGCKSVEDTGDLCLQFMFVEIVHQIFLSYQDRARRSLCRKSEA